MAIVHDTRSICYGFKFHLRHVMKKNHKHIISCTPSHYVINGSNWNMCIVGIRDFGGAMVGHHQSVNEVNYHNLVFLGCLLCVSYDGSIIRLCVVF